ncbi:MAG TPA: archease [Candidatus Anammoximicrobium sp.]|nr:archease [Candidatus Anammoximicrobium sp.]
MFEVFDHTADIGLRIRAEDRSALFAEAARALFSLLVLNLDAVRTIEQRRYEIAGEQDDYLLFDWLSELLYTFETEHLLLSQFAVELGPTGLRATCRGEAIDRARHEMDHEIKAITYHGLKVEPDGNGWMAEMVLDI